MSQSGGQGQCAPGPTKFFLCVCDGTCTGVRMREDTQYSSARFVLFFVFNIVVRQEGV